MTNVSTPTTSTSHRRRGIRNPVAKSLRTIKPKVVRNKKKYTRKGRKDEMS
jgi:hypothetical protein